jgi:hypothetical protein
MDKVQFFLLCAGLGLVAAVVTWAFDRPLRSILEGTTAKPDMVPEPQADAGAVRHPAQ